MGLTWILVSAIWKEISEELVLQFKGKDYIEYVIKERFKRDYILKDLLNDSEENSGDLTVINIKFKTQDNGILMFVAGQTGYSVLRVGME